METFCQECVAVADRYIDFEFSHDFLVLERTGEFYLICYEPLSRVATSTDNHLNYNE